VKDTLKEGTEAVMKVKQEILASNMTIKNKIMPKGTLAFIIKAKKENVNSFVRYSGCYPGTQEKAR
jgi:hypothetical protein